MTDIAGAAHATSDLIASILYEEVPSYALIRRPAAHDGRDVVDVLLGEHFELSSLAELAATPFRADRSLPEHGVLALLPFRQIAERGYDHVDDGEKIQVLHITQSAILPTQEMFTSLPHKRGALVNGRFDLDDHQYAELARRIIRDEVGTGAGANFVLKRSYLAHIEAFDNAAALSFFRQLVALEVGAYWTFIVRLGGRTFVGATPERHVSLSGGVATMNPISGTYRYPATGPTLDGLLSFLADAKETNELYMVVDEELKMMARICDRGGSIHGPSLRPMAKLAHTEYHITGDCRLRIDHVLRETLFAPTITGSPLENACRVIKKYEPLGRGYYSGVIGLLGVDDSGRDILDSSILIRTADISEEGNLRISVGATLVRDSDPLSEAAETKAKALGLLLALGSDPRADASLSVDAPASVSDRFSAFEKDARVRDALTARNDVISPFWMKDSRTRFQPLLDFMGLRAAIIDAEDNFTWMIQHQMRSLGLSVDLRRHDEEVDLDQFDIIVMGPGPGDPCDLTDRRVAALHETINTLLTQQRPFLAVCLSHQILCRKLDLEIVQRPLPNQGVRQQIDLFGTTQWVGFYNSFNALCTRDRIDGPGQTTVHVSRDAQTNDVFALRSKTFSSFQFHPESVLSKDGDLILRSHLHDLVLPRTTRATHRSVPAYEISEKAMQL